MRLLKLGLLALVVAAAAAAWCVLSPFGPQGEVFVDLPSGMRTTEMGAALADAGVVRSGVCFDLLRPLLGGKLKAGEYRFDHAATMVEVYRRIARGDVYTRTLLVPEGYNIYDIAAAAEAAGLGTREGFVEAAREGAALVRGWLPGAESAEGFLYPDTYRFSRHTSDAQMVMVMVERFHAEAQRLGLAERVGAVVTMASLVEKETGVAAERPLVAGVFANRLAKGMPLQTDPTVIYAAQRAGQWRGTIYASDLARDSTYNTYKHAGLPPGPICNPGAASLLAAMQPAKTEFLYFVSDAAGHSRFSAGLGEQAKNVQAYRRKSVTGKRR